LATPVYAFVMTFVLLKAVGAVMPLRGPESDESLGMDGIYHGEEAYPSGEGAILVTLEDGGEAAVPVAQA
jgi:Amt family ammonium transporter